MKNDKTRKTPAPRNVSADPRAETARETLWTGIVQFTLSAGVEVKPIAAQGNVPAYLFARFNDTNIHFRDGAQPKHGVTATYKLELRMRHPKDKNDPTKILNYLTANLWETIEEATDRIVFSPKLTATMVGPNGQIFGPDDSKALVGIIPLPKKAAA